MNQPPPAHFPCDNDGSGRRREVSDPNPLSVKVMLEYGLADLSEGAAVLRSRCGGYRGRGSKHEVLAEGDQADACLGIVEHMCFFSPLVLDVHIPFEFRVRFDMGCISTIYLKIPLNLCFPNEANAKKQLLCFAPPKKNIDPSLSCISSCKPLLIISSSLRLTRVYFKAINADSILSQC